LVTTDPRSEELFRVKAGTGVMRGIKRDLSVSVGAAEALGLATVPERVELPAARDLVYLIGAPGAGKSTLMAALTRNAEIVATSTAQPKRVVWGMGRWVCCELGVRRPDFPGTDALPMNVQPRAEAWMAQARYPLVLGEGDRLGNAKFLTACREQGWVIHLVYLEAPDSTLRLRRSARGSDQNEAWCAGRATKARNLASWALGQNIHVVRLSAEHHPGYMAARVAAHIPALHRLDLGELSPDV